MNNQGSRENTLKQILEKIFALPECPQVDRFLAVEFAKNKKYGSKDRKWYSEQIFFVVRNLYLILYLVSSRNLQASSRNVEASSHGVTAGSSTLETFAHKINTPKKFWRAVQQISFEDIRAFDSTNLFDDIPKFSPHTTSRAEMVVASVPLWLESYVLRRFPHTSDFNAFLQFQNTRPPIWIRLNHSDKRAHVLEELAKNEIEFKTHENQNSISISGAKSIYNLASFTQGLFEIQDYASQEIGNALTLKSGDCVWDVCAGNGGKTVQIASALKNKGVLYATDIREHTLEELKKRIKKAQFYNVRALLWDGKIIPNFPKEIQKNQGFDCVLIDAPCSSSGTWRRRPDEKYKIGGTTNDVVEIRNDIQKFSEIQYSLLKTVHSTVKLGGQLAYATCSFFKEENEDVIEKFLHEHTHFKLVKMKMVGLPEQDSDAMFIALLERTE